MTKSEEEKLISCSFRELIFYFLKLGTIGFGGPLALVGYMQRDLVEERRWFSRDDYLQGFSLAQLSPGPLSTQLAMYFGWVKKGALGAALIAMVFLLPSFLCVLSFSILYKYFGTLPSVQGAFYGLNAAVIAIIIRSSIRLIRIIVQEDRFLLGSILSLHCLLIFWIKSEIILCYLFSGLLMVLVKSLPKINKNTTYMVAPFLSFLPSLSYGSDSMGLLIKIFFYFTCIGAFVFGGGVAIIPFLHEGVVKEFHWLTEQQFLDAIAIAMMSPGPILMVVVFIGYMVAGTYGALCSALGIFLPCYLCVVVFASSFRRFYKIPSLKAFVTGVTAAATGAIIGSALMLAHKAVIDLYTSLIFLMALLIVITMKKVPEPLIIVFAAGIGLLLKM